MFLMFLLSASRSSKVFHFCQTGNGQIEGNCCLVMKTAVVWTREQYQKWDCTDSMRITTATDTEICSFTKITFTFRCCFCQTQALFTLPVIWWWLCAENVYILQYKSFWFSDGGQKRCLQEAVFAGLSECLCSWSTPETIALVLLLLLLLLLIQLCNWW